MDSVQHQSQDHPLLLRRRKCISASISAFPTKNTEIDNLELQLIKPALHSYSSLRDILPSSAVDSPKPKAATPGSDIRIRNRLVKQAALAYLQPMSTAPGSTGGDFFRRLWTRVAAVIDFLCGNVFVPSMEQFGLPGSGFSSWQRP
ncbi:hypothetical protein PHJA_002438700 [Phtheirospermum japonicum]|uniref:Uncharacterized protein n=1 Tax=Phtheirospermum japonicum TaxID=374723 RepID=A0A830CZE9_9LAMI|nr:hypothetical protein PHJA_002438700 [Phtheirospermum japonicum]